jgi:hypothetical protein
MNPGVIGIMGIAHASEHFSGAAASHLSALTRTRRRQTRRLPDARAGELRTGDTASPRRDPDRGSVRVSQRALLPRQTGICAGVRVSSRGVPGSFVITSGQGLVTPETVVTLDGLRELSGVPIDPADARYREPLERTVAALFAAAGPDCDYVLLGSVATTKYLEPISAIVGDRLLFPQEFTGRGDMSRGGLMLRCAAAGEPLMYTPVGNLTRHGPKPPKLTPRRWK